MIEIAHILNREYGFKYPILLDGEATSKNKTLTHLMTQFRRIKEADPTIFELRLFDMAIPNMKFKDRHEYLKKSINSSKLERTHLLEYFPFNNFSIDALNKLVKEQSTNIGDEGVILQWANAPYVGSDTFFAIKGKFKDTVDLKITGFNFGKGRLEDKLGTFICDYKGKPLKVSGKLSDKDREEYAKNPPIGKIAEVEFKEETHTGSLRDPIFVRIRDDKS